MKIEITLNEVCNILGKSKRSISRNIKKGKLKPMSVINGRGL